MSDSPDGTPSPDAAAVPDAADLARLVERVETSLLGGQRKYTRIEMAEKSGLALDEVRALWRALGFATVDDDERRVFTDADLEALKRVKRLASVGNIDDEVMRAMTRIIGQSFARLASWQGQLVVEIVAKSPQLLEGGGDSVLELVDELIPLTGELHDYVWRRQLAAYFTRISAGETGSSSTKAVGFADMAAFTAFTRRSSEAELRGVLELFESVATDVVGANHGQIVKTIGDEVLFVADTADRRSRDRACTRRGVGGDRRAATPSRRARGGRGREPPRRRLRTDRQHREQADLDRAHRVDPRRPGHVGRA